MGIGEVGGELPFATHSTNDSRTPSTGTRRCFSPSPGKLPGTRRSCVSEDSHFVKASVAKMAQSQLWAMGTDNGNCNQNGLGTARTGAPVARSGGICAVAGRAALWRITDRRSWGPDLTPGRIVPRDLCGLCTCCFRPASTTRARHRCCDQRHRVPCPLYAGRCANWSLTDDSDRGCRSTFTAGVCRCSWMAALGGV